MSILQRILNKVTGQVSEEFFRSQLLDELGSTNFDDDAADQGERQSRIREGDDDPDLAIPSGVARAQLRSYAVLLEVLRNPPMPRVLSNSQILRLTFIF